MKIVKRAFLLILTLSNTLCFGQLYSITSTEVFVYFESDSYLLDDSNQDSLKQCILDIGSTNIREIYIEGHTDSFASEEYNTILSNNRADHVQSYLHEMGIPLRFLKLESFGKSKIISSDHSINRRVRVFVIHESDLKTAMYPPKFIQIKCKDKNTGKPVVAQIGFEYEGEEMKFSSTSKAGSTRALPIVNDQLDLVCTADRYLSQYLTVPQSDFDKPSDTLIYEIELMPVVIVSKITFSNIYFFTDTDKIKQESEPDLLRLLSILQNNTSTFIEIQGHMNYPINRRMNSIQDRYNRELSYKRAKAVNKYLVDHGIDQSRLTYKGMSNSRMKFPMPSNTQQEDQNKRVEIYTLKEKKS